MIRSAAAGLGDSLDRPLIGVTTSEVRLAEQVEHTPQGEPPRREMALGLRYLAAIEEAGGIPVVIPPVHHGVIAPLLENLDGLCLSGGPDIHPEAYGGVAGAELGPTWPDLDRFELALVRQADARRLAILAICRGAQALNVARMGTLFQHVPDRFGGTVQHRQKGYGPRPAHTVEVEPGSTLARSLGATTVEVNSYHHQAAATLGRGLRAVAWSPDGVIEGIEAPGRDFAVGVQWHAEAMTERPEQASLFGAFVDAARGHLTSRAQRRVAA